MQKLSYYLILIFISINSYCTYSQDITIHHGKTLESLSMKSPLLKSDINYTVYLPADYENSTLSYPVVYLLHGYSDDETGWTQFGEIQISVDEAIANRTIPPMIIIMPDAKVSWYMNDYLKKYPYEDMFFKEFIPFIESQYRIKSKKEFRAVAGLSMGGFGAILYAMKHPDMFSSCVGLSAALRTDETIINLDKEGFDRRYSFLIGEGLTGKNRITEYWKDNSPFHLLEKIDTKTLESVRWYFDCGDDDHLYTGNETFHILLRDQGIYHEYRVRNGAHNWLYWRTGIIDGLEFIGEEFHR